MSKVERVRELLEGLPSPDEMKERLAEGWRPIAVEWERGASEDDAASRRRRYEVPYGVRISGDCFHLEEDPEEMGALTMMLALLLSDRTLSEVADQLNRQGHRTRERKPWSQVTVFDMLPRLIEAGPEIKEGESWNAESARWGTRSQDL